MSHKQQKQISSSRMASATLLIVVLTVIFSHQQAHASYLLAQSTQQMQNNFQQQQQHQLPTTTSQAAYNQQQQQQEQLPIIIPFSFNQNVQENHRAFVMCTTASGEMPVTFSWMKDNQLLSPQLAQVRRIQVKSDQDSSTLKISTVRLDHAGNYTCVAKNRFGTHLHSAQLVVLAEPRWLKEPLNEPIVATRGQTIVIDCQTTGYPPPEQKWQIKTHTPGSEFEPLASIVGGSGRVSLAHNGSLVILNADKSDEANYRCKSANGIGKGISWSTSLKVTVPAHFEPSVKRQQQTSVIRKLDQAQLRCDAYGDQPITIEWFKNKQPLLIQQQQHDGGVLLAGDVRYSIHSNNNPLRNGWISQLVIKQAQRSDNSVYECVTRNPYGRDRLAIELVVQEEPDNIQELQLTQVSSRSATLMWSEPYDGRSPITSYLFQYRRVATGGAGDEPPARGSPADFSPQLQALDTIDQHQAAFGNSGAGGDWQHANRIVLPMQANASQMGSVKSITIEKLDPSSKYVLRALAINGIGQGKFSQPMEFQTDEEAPEVGPVNIRAEPINSTSIQVSWDEIPRSKHMGRIQGYYIGYRVANNNSAAANFIYKPFILNDLALAAASPSPAASTTGGQHQQQVAQQLQSADGEQRLGTAIHDLRRDTVYEITVVAFNSRGSGPSSDFVVCKTIEMEAPKPVKLTIRRESNESIFIEWQRDASDQNPVDDYVLYQEKNSASQEWLQVRLPGNQTQYKAPGLKCGTRYQFYITAHNKVGKSVPSEVVSASTSGALPVIPSKTSLIKMINSTCLVINLNSFQDNGCRIKTFTVRYRVDKLNLPVDGQHASPQQLTASAASQIVGSNGMSPSHQALTAASQLGGKTVLAGQTASSANPHASEWTAIRPKSNTKQQRANEEDRMEYLCDLSPLGEYTIHVSATNDVGRSEIEYSVPMWSDELRHSALKELLEVFSGLPNVFAYIPSMIVFLLAGLLLAVVSLILYTTAIKYYQKFVILQNQMRATRRAKADEKRRRKLAEGMNHSARQKMAELWAEEYDEEEDDEAELEDQELDEDEEACGRRVMNINDIDGDATDELRSTSSSSANSNATIHRRTSSNNFKNQRQRVTGRALARGHSHLSHQTLGRQRRPQHYQQQQQQHLHQYSSSSLAAQQHRHSHYLSNIANSAFDTSSIDSPACSKQSNSACMSMASNDSILNGGRFQCLNSKQYVKMNEYSMLPTISGNLSPATNDIYGSVAMRQPQAAHHYRLAGTSPSNNSSSSASNNTASTTATGSTVTNLNSNNNDASSLYYSTLRRTNMQTYLPQRRSQPAPQTRPPPGANVGDIYGYYMAPQLQQQQQQQQQSTSQVRVQAQQAQVAAAAAAAAAAAQLAAANEAANSIFVPPQHQIIYSSPGRQDMNYR